VADADNLAWKLARVVAGTSPPSLLDTYCNERRAASQENIRQSTRSTDFITPKFEASRRFRDATLALAKDFPFARALINSGRLSAPTAHIGSPLDTPDGDDEWVGGPPPGRAMIDAPRGDGWLIDAVGADFTLLNFGASVDAADVPVVALECSGLAARRYDAQPGTTYLIRPDRYVAARWRRYDRLAVRAAVARATGHTMER
jgi:3-(3-hydroxy-phenyl)propionate hydroxylase